MRSTIFASFADLPNEFREDINILWELSSSQRSQLIPYVLDLSKAEFRTEFEESLNLAVSEIGENVPELLRAIKSLVYIANKWDPVRDSPEDSIRDFNELELIPTEAKDEAQAFLQEFFTELQKDNLRRLRKQFSTKLLPSFAGIVTSIDFRAVIDKPYDIGIDIDSYDPRCIDFVPVILVKLRSDIGDPDEFHFQCEARELGILINALNAALKDLESAKHSLPGGTA